LDIIVPDEFYSDIEFLRGVAKLQNGVLYIYNLDGFLSSELAAEIVPLLAVDTLSPADPTR
jgi:hypothetical protein